MTTDPTPTVTLPALQYAEEHTLADTVPLNDEMVLVRTREGETWEPHDVRPELIAGPRRSKGTISVHDADSFAAALEQRGHAVIYADETALAMVAVLNDDHGDEPGWRDYRVSLALRPTPQWDAWVKGQGLGEQVRFAERIEDGMPEITSPDGATLLEIAQTFHASIGAEFRQANRLRDGQTQFTYTEDVTAGAGANRQLAIPEMFELAVQPFVGSDAYRVQARLRFRIVARGEAKGQLQIGYTLVRPEDIERLAFNSSVETVAALVPEATILRGPAPTPAS